MMSNKRNTGVLVISGALLMVGLLAPTFTAAQDDRNTRRTHRASLPLPQETPPGRMKAERDTSSHSAIVTIGSGRGTRSASFERPDSLRGFNMAGDEGRSGFSGRRMPGQVLSPFTQDRLRLTEEQRKQLAELQKEVDTRLGKILTTDQKQRLQSPRERGPVAFWGPSGSGWPPRG